MDIPIGRAAGHGTLSLETRSIEEVPKRPENRGKPQAQAGLGVGEVRLGFPVLRVRCACQRRKRGLQPFKEGRHQPFSPGPGVAPPRAWDQIITDRPFTTVARSGLAP